MPQLERIGRLQGPLTLTCITCGHAATWTVREAVAKLGGDCGVFEARRRLRCSACGEREGRRIDFRS